MSKSKRIIAVASMHFIRQNNSNLSYLKSSSAHSPARLPQVVIVVGWARVWMSCCWRREPLGRSASQNTFLSQRKRRNPILARKFCPGCPIFPCRNSKRRKAVPHEVSDTGSFATSLPPPLPDKKPEEQ